ncbi:MAG: hypothetical protein J5529_06845 [Prevotella sp.]|nr:hypothetical protein [Prevotella sp.]
MEKVTKTAIIVVEDEFSSLDEMDNNKKAAISRKKRIFAVENISIQYADDKKMD